ncbi:hypothetical protein AG1IA_05601 [Rhizoctonia solani AG-1 IA]|uniref:Uncharacterized protein n=1 Tax=Thanatephorus cucumeris (strain AG1-IA) TaxID=983506 RepID=L8WQG9_THACA|nr:hypothetical protein AG1IA_05601 [Rhizoctonia solani AG-1 IA]
MYLCISSTLFKALLVCGAHGCFSRIGVCSGKNAAKGIVGGLRVKLGDALVGAFVVGLGGEADADLDGAGW